MRAGARKANSGKKVFIQAKLDGRLAVSSAVLPASSLILICLACVQSECFQVAEAMSIANLLLIV